MKKISIDSFQEYLNCIETIRNEGHKITLYRGQSDDNELLPTIARDNPKIDTTDLEIKMLDDLKRRSMLLINRAHQNDWEWLVFAQHFGLKTRLLDWSSNPLTGLWFACKNQYKMKNNSFVYILKADESMLVDFAQTESPFQHSATRILRPSLNNERIIAQAGWFTAHKYSKAGKQFIPLEKNGKIKDLITRIEIPANSKSEILKSLSVFGINSRTIFPDITGLCEHLNWKYDNVQ